MIKELIQTSRQTIGHKLDVDIDKIHEMMKLLKECLKPKYANKFYWYMEKQTVFIDLDKNNNVKKVRSDHNHFFGSDYIGIFGISLVKKEKETEIKTYNITEDIPLAFQSNADHKLWELRQKIDDINNDIKIELNKILAKDVKYKDCIDKEINKLAAKEQFILEFNTNLANSDITKRVHKKINQFYKHNAIAIEISNVSIGYNDIEAGVHAKVGEYQHTICLDLSYARNEIYLGTLKLSEDGKTKFKPYFKNEKYFKDEVTSLRYMRNTFKKHLLSKGLANE